MLAAAAAVLPASAAAPAWSLDELMQALARNKVSRATFVEKKYLALLDAPAPSSGELQFTAPDRLERRTLQPRPETVVLQGDTLTLTRGSRAVTLRLQDHPALVALTESVRATLAGDRAALERHYRVRLEGSRARWAMTLTPTDPATRAFVLELRLEGSGGQVRTVETLQSDKDRSVMTITPVPGT